MGSLESEKSTAVKKTGAEGRLFALSDHTSLYVSGLQDKADTVYLLAPLRLQLRLLMFLLTRQILC